MSDRPTGADRPNPQATADPRRDDDVRLPTVLVTGAAGRVGSAVRRFLRERFDLVLFDRVATPAPQPGERVVVGDLAVRADVRAALEGVDAVLHLACVHGLELAFDDSLDANFRATVHVLDEARRAGVRRFVYASSHHVHGAHARDGFAGDAAPFAPDAYYGLGKAFGELACALHAERFGLEVFVARIGNADPEVADDRALRLWTSARDLAELFAIGLSHPDVRFDVVYGVSICPEPLYRNERALELGYRPRDRAVDHLAAGFLPFDAMPERLGRGYVGGAYMVAPLPTGEEER
jgi:uronate dehydrogenase